METEKLIELINQFAQKGYITDPERSILLLKAKSFNISDNTVDILIRQQLETKLNEIKVQPITQTNTNVEEVKYFYKSTFPKIFKTIFTRPLQGTYELFSLPSERNYRYALILIFSTGLIFTLLPWIAAGNARNFIGFKYFLMIGLVSILCLFLISIISYFIKSNSGRLNFKDELLTGGICGIPLSLMIVVLFVLSLFSEDVIQPILRNPTEFYRSGIVIILFILYCLLLMVNIFQQSLRSSGTNEAISWYLSPLSILISIYLSGKIVSGLL